MKFTIPTVAATAAVAVLTLIPRPVQSDVLHVAGSGTTNPSKCYWLIMQQLQERTKIATKLTYRAVGSSTGQHEFFGVNNTGTDAWVPYNDFGSGDIPISTANYQAMEAKGEDIFHLPIVLGAITLFHSVPGVPDGKGGLNLTSCLIAKIFKREIREWDDPEILEINPRLEQYLPSPKYSIKVARRVKGSSSTASVTSYLHQTCEPEWPLRLVGKEIDWESGTLECEGSGGMSDCINENEGTIGYIDAGHGHSKGLKEIELKNKNEKYISSKDAMREGGIAAAAVSLPDNFEANFGQVNLLNQPGDWTWPIVAMSYIYVRQNLPSHMEPQEKALLIAFLESLYDEETIDQCKQFGFTPVNEATRTKAITAINTLKSNVKAGGATLWTFETKTDPGAGEGDYVISVKRRTGAELMRSTTEGDVEDLQEAISALEMKISSLESTTTVLSANNDVNPEDYRMYTDDDAQKLTAALTLAAISFTLWGLAIILGCLKFFNKI